MNAGFAVDSFVVVVGGVVFVDTDDFGGVDRDLRETVCQSFVEVGVDTIGATVGFAERNFVIKVCLVADFGIGKMPSKGDGARTALVSISKGDVLVARAATLA